jgi:hypothetical protein
MIKLSRGKIKISYKKSKSKLRNGEDEDAMDIDNKAYALPSQPILPSSATVPEVSAKEALLNKKLAMLTFTSMNGIPGSNDINDLGVKQRKTINFILRK